MTDARLARRDWQIDQNAVIENQLSSLPILGDEERRLRWNIPENVPDPAPRFSEQVNDFIGVLVVTKFREIGQDAARGFSEGLKRLECCVIPAQVTGPQPHPFKNRTRHA